jgi:TolB protein
MSPDGRAIVFESHGRRAQERGRITMLRLDTSDRYLDLTEDADDCREPNWSPAGNLIVYQKRTNDQWEVWLYDVTSGLHRQLTGGEGDKTDATFSPDGRFVLYSGETDDADDGTEDLDGDNLFAMLTGGGKPVPITRHSSYHGASSWSPDGAYVVLEAAAEPPNGKQGTFLHVTPVPKALLPARR